MNSPAIKTENAEKEVFQDHKNTERPWCSGCFKVQLLSFEFVMGFLGVPGKSSFTCKTLFSKTKEVSSLHVCGIILFFKWHISSNQSYSVINVTPFGIYSFHKHFLLLLLRRDMVPLRSWASLFWLSLLPESVPGSWACVWFLAEFQHSAKGLAHRVRNWGYTSEIKWSLYKGRPVCLNK